MVCPMGISKLTTRRKMSSRLRKKVEDIIDHVQATLDPEALYLIGSMADGEHHQDSDLDLVVVMVGAINRQKSAIKVHPTRPHKEVPLDLHLVSKKEWEEFSTCGGVCFEARQNGRLVYQKAVL